MQLQSGGKTAVLVTWLLQANASLPLLLLLLLLLLQYFVSSDVGGGKQQWYGFHKEPADGEAQHGTARQRHRGHSIITG